MTAGTDADRMAELEESNARLRRLLNQRDAPGELRHRLWSTLALLRAVIRKSADTDRDLPGYVDHLEERLDAIGRAQSYADRHGTVNLRDLLADELLRYGASEGERLLLSGPEVQLTPRAGQILALAFHELAVNAVEHGAFGVSQGRLEVSWSVPGPQPGTHLVLLWTEDGAMAGTGPRHSGFGTEVLTRMLAYDLKAETEILFEPDRLRCTIRLPLSDQVGHIP